MMPLVLAQSPHSVAEAFAYAQEEHLRQPTLTWPMRRSHSRCRSSNDPQPPTDFISCAMVEIIGMCLPRNLKPDYEQAADFLFATPGPTINVFAAHHDNGKVYGRTFEKIAADRASLIDWMKRGQVRGFNIYFNINGLRVKLDLIKKAKEGHVSTVYALHGDFDASGFTTDEERQEARQSIRERLLLSSMPPSILADSGGGFNGLWLLADPVAVNDDNRLMLKSLNVGLAEQFGGDDVENLDRVLRTPFTWNFPNAKKRKEGRGVSLAGVVPTEHRLYTLADFKPGTKMREEKASKATSTTPKRRRGIASNAYDDIGRPIIPDRLDHAKLRPLDPDLRKLIVEGDPDRNIGDGTRSAAVFYVACELRRCWWSDGDIIACICDPALDISRHIRDQHQRDPHQQAARVVRQLNELGIAPYLTEEFEESHDEDIE
jgi:hypothetical protein